MANATRNPAALLLVGVALCGLATGTVLWLAEKSRGETDRALWEAHRARVAAGDAASYHVDRFSDIRGTIRDEDGRPLPGAQVQLLDVAAVLDAAREPAGRRERLLSTQWPIEATATTGADGVYLFPRPRPGAKAMRATFPGRTVGWKQLFVVRDGYSSWGQDATLSKAMPLELPIEESLLAPGAASAVWLTSTGLFAGAWRSEVRDGVARFTGPGGQASSGFAWLEQDRSVKFLGSWKVGANAAAGRLSLETGAEPKLQIVGEILLSDLLDEPHRWLFGSGATPSPEAVPAAAGAASGSIHGFVERGFLPASIRALHGRTQRESLSSEAAEFQFDGVPAGIYEIRGRGEMDAPRFSRLVFVAPGRTSEVHLSSADEIQLRNRRSRILHGWVRSEAGLPVAKAAVWAQDTRSFRYFVERQETDSSGYFRFASLEPGASYTIFAQPPDESDALKDFKVVTSRPEAREELVELQIFRLAIQANAPAGAMVRLERKRGGSEEYETVAEVPAKDDGAVRFRNVAYGTYRIVACDGTPKNVIWGPGSPVPE
ncbi:MAG: carboxypeptidase regulatory-like domain-containing protein [Planctomycetes bacterium]|nr:carboxypeptidase regulatory-like domain-containing protein [Planctomycetota bacterium]